MSEIAQNGHNGQSDIAELPPHVWAVVCTEPSGDYAHYKPWKQNGVTSVHRTEEAAVAELCRVAEADWPQDMPGSPWPGTIETALEQLAARGIHLWVDYCPIKD